MCLKVTNVKDLLLKVLQQLRIGVCFIVLKFHSGEAGKNQPHGDRRMLVLDGDIGSFVFTIFR